jgi:hypothetical protein
MKNYTSKEMILGFCFVGSVMGAVSMVYTPWNVPEKGTLQAKNGDETSVSSFDGANSTARTKIVDMRHPAVAAQVVKSEEQLDAARMPSRRGPGDFAVGTKLTAYAILNKKALLTDKESEEKVRMLADPELIRGLEEVLLQASLSDPQLEFMQDNAIDLLFEARGTVNGQIAEKVLRTIVEDARTEDAKLDMETRRSLAGIKAEIVYQWSAREPDSAPEIASWLPGPVSRKIWNNVIRAQATNEFDSSAMDYNE